MSSRAALFNSAPAESVPTGILRKPVGRAGEVARTQSTETVLRTQKRQQRKQGKPVENRLHWLGIRLAPADREIILAQLFRCLGKYDPRAIPRIISKRTGITEQAIDYVLQQTCLEFREWSREIRAGIARADAAAAAAWGRKAS